MSAPSIDWQELAEQRGRRNARLERELRHVQAERRRLERLLSVGLQIAAGPDCDPLAMLEVVGALAGDNLAQAAFVREEKDVEHTDLRPETHDGVVHEEENVHFHGPEPPRLADTAPAAAQEADGGA